MATLEGLVEKMPFRQESLDGITDPKEFYATYHRQIRENLQAGGLMPPTAGITKPVTDAQDTGSFFKDTVNSITKYAGVRAFDTKGDTYDERRFKFIAAEEGYRDHVYLDAVKRRTIGYGFNLDDPGNARLAQKVLGVDPAGYDSILTGKRNITQREARALFEASASVAEGVVNQRIGDVPLNSNQRLALVSLAYNHPNLIGPKITAAIKSGDGEAALREIRTNSNKFNLRGIQSRREREARLFAGYEQDESKINWAGAFGISSANAATTSQYVKGDDKAVVDNWASYYAKNPQTPAAPAESLLSPEAGRTLKMDGENILRADGTPVKAGGGIFGSHVGMMINDIVANQVNRAFGRDVLDWQKTTYDSSFFKEEELQALLKIIGSSYVRHGGKSSGAVDYTKDYKDGLSDVSFKSNSLGLFDPESGIKKTLGRFTWSVNKQGELIVQDRYNFNDAEKYRKQYPDDWEKAKHLAGLVGKLATGTGELGAYGIIRRFAALYGSQEGTGATFNINLGKVDLKRLSANSRKNNQS